MDPISEVAVVATEQNGGAMVRIWDEKKEKYKYNFVGRCGVEMPRVWHLVSKTVLLVSVDVLYIWIYIGRYTCSMGVVAMPPRTIPLAWVWQPSLPREYY